MAITVLFIAAWPNAFLALFTLVITVDWAGRFLRLPLARDFQTRQADRVAVEIVLLLAGYLWVCHGPRIRAASGRAWRRVRKPAGGHEHLKL